MGVSLIFYLNPGMDAGRIVEQAVVGLGYQFVGLEAGPRARLLRVFIDAPDRASGVTVDDCARVSNHLTRLFAVENIDFGRLEVSSPGLDRPLRLAEDYQRFAGQEARVRIRVPVQGRRNFTGVLAGCEDGKLRLQCGGELLAFDLALVEKARLVPNIASDFGSPRRAGK